MVAFAKIMKKYDKVVRQKFGPVYIKEVEQSYFATSDKVQDSAFVQSKLLLSLYSCVHVSAFKDMNWADRWLSQCVVSNINDKAGDHSVEIF